MIPTMVPLMADSGSNSLAHSDGGKKTLGRYEILERLFSKGSAETFRARVRGLAGFDRIFAVKCLRTERHGGWTMSDPFLKTAKRSAAVVDARIARVLEADIIDGTAISVTEFIFGIDLERFLQCAEVSGDLATGNDEQALRWQKIICTIGSEVANGMAAAHALDPPFVHGHLHPRNIFISNRASIKITDGGLYRAAMLTGDIQPLAPQSYEAPEYGDPQSAITPAVDVYSLGAILFQLATGEPYSIAKGPDEAVISLNTLCPSMARALAALLDSDPSKRPHAKACAESLRTLSQSLATFAVGPELVSLVRSFSVFSGNNTAETIDARPQISPPTIENHKPNHSLGAFRPPLIPRPRTTESNSETATEAAPIFSSATDQRSSMEPIAPRGKRRNPTIMSFPVLASPTAAHAPAIATETNKPDAMVQPESNDWAARALAALGDQAGISMAPIPLDPIATQPPNSLPSITVTSIETTLDGVSLPSSLNEAGHQMGTPVHEVNPYIPEDSSLEVDWPEEKAAPIVAAISDDNVDVDINEVIDTPPLPEPVMISASSLTRPEIQTRLNEQHSPPVGANPLFAVPPTQRSAKRTAPDLPVVPLTPKHPRHKRLLIGIAGVVCVSGLIGGGAGWLFSQSQRSAALVTSSNRIAESKPRAGVPLGSEPLHRPMASTPPAQEKQSALVVQDPVPPAQQPKAGEVTLTIASTPAGATIWLRGKERGKTPLMMKEASGSANLILVKEGFVSLKKNVQLTDGHSINETLASITPPMQGEARFRAECKTKGKYPVIVDGQETGILCPYSKMRVSPGIHRIGILIPSTGIIREKEITLQKGVRSVSFPE